MSQKLRADHSKTMECHRDTRGPLRVYSYPLALEALEGPQNCQWATKARFFAWKLSILNLRSFLSFILFKNVISSNLKKALRTDKQMGGRTDGWTTGQTDGRMDGRSDRRTDGRTGGKIIL